MPRVVDLVQLAFDRLNARFGGFRLDAAFGELLLELSDQSVVLASQFLHACGLLLGEGSGGRMKLVKLPLEVVGDVRRRDRRDEGKALGLRQIGGGRFQLLDRERLDHVDVDPVLVALGCEEVALDAPACGKIGFASHEARLGVVRLDGPVEDSAADVVGIIAVVGAAHLREHADLAVDVGSDGVSLRDAERDLAGCERLEDARCQLGEAHALLDEAGRNALRPGLKVLFITGFAENAIVGNGHMDPGMELLTKPFTLEALSMKVAEMLKSPAA